MRVLVLIPALNLADRIGSLLHSLRTLAPEAEILVVDDGSTDGTAGAARAVEGVRVLVHPENRGKGAALRTGFEVALRERFDAVVTMDGDGQHPPKCVPEFVGHAEATGADLVVGTRERRGTRMPLHRRMSNKMSTWFASKAAGTKLPDSQSGYRLVRTRVIEAVPTRSDRYEMETEFLIGAARRGFRIEGMPIPTVYADERSHIHVLRDTGLFLKLLWSMRGGRS
ncbi:MAG: glycosyltransferase family 2 protein [Candidatus Eisenbacteria bacterium]